MINTAGRSPGGHARGALVFLTRNSEYDTVAREYDTVARNFVEPVQKKSIGTQSSIVKCSLLKCYNTYTMILRIPISRQLDQLSK